MPSTAGPSRDNESGLSSYSLSRVEEVSPKSLALICELTRGHSQALVCCSLTEAVCPIFLALGACGHKRQTCDPQTQEALRFHTVIQRVGPARWGIAVGRRVVPTERTAPVGENHVAIALRRLREQLFHGTTS